MKITAALIEKFFNGDCDDQEKQAVKDYFNDNPEVLQHFLSDDKWNSFQTQRELPLAVSKKMFGIIKGNTFKKQALRKMYFKYAAAAAVLVMACTGYLLLINSKPVKNTPVAANINKAIVPQQKIAVNDKINSTKNIEEIHLNDGSVVQLSPHSEIRYDEPFTNNRRDIFLKGEALFKVAKDKTKPFTVYAKGLGTTALGTVFKITAFNGITKTTTVHLIRGKVIIKPDSLLRSKGVKDTYLTAGQQLNFNESLFTVSVQQVDKFSNADRLAVKENKPAAKEILSFNNQPLTDIFKIIGEKYQLSFSYKEGLLKGMGFTGVFNSNKESLEDFFNTIALLNNLTIKQENSIVYITQ